MKNKKWVTNNICRNSMQGKVENETVSEPLLLINRRIGGFHVIHCRNASHASLQIWQVTCRLINVTKNYYLKR
jgi:hypothetical protein